MSKELNNLMQAAAEVVLAAKETVSEAGRQALDDEAHIPEAVFNRLGDAVDKWDIAASEYGDEPEPITNEQAWWDWFLGEEDEAGPTRNQRLTRLMRR